MNRIYRALPPDDCNGNIKTVNGIVPQQFVFISYINSNLQKDVYIMTGNLSKKVKSGIRFFGCRSFQVILPELKVIKR